MRERFIPVWTAGKGSMMLWDREKQEDVWIMTPIWVSHRG